MARKILVLEADQQLVSLLVPLLEERGYDVTREVSGHQALDVMDTSRPDLVIVGEQLSDIDGIGWIIKLRQKDKTMKLAFLSQLWRGEEFYQQVTKELKVDQVFHRPIKSGLFALQIEALWAEKRMPPSPVSSSTPTSGASAGAFPALPGSTGSGGLPAVPGDTALAPFPIGAPPPVPGAQAVAVPTPGMAMPVPTVQPPANAIAAAADATLLAFRQKFSRSLPNRIQQISDTLAAVDRGTPSVKSMAEARRLSHNLKGTARSCGFDALGGAAEQIENSLRDMLEVPGTDKEREWLKLDNALVQVKKECETVRLHCADYVPTAEELQNLNPNSAKAKVLIVSKEVLPNLSGKDDNGGIPLELIGAHTHADALARAAEKSLDAALIEIVPEQKDASFQLARELRSLAGYDNLPLGFIYNYDGGSDRSEATHAGASIFLERPYGIDTLRQVVQHLITIRSEGGRARVLIVDDDEDFSELISVTLGNEGMLIRALHDPRRVLEALEEFAPDLMLLDVMMPGILGFEVCKKVRETGRWQDLPILFLTAQTDLNSRLAAFDAGGDDYLVKPVIRVELLQRVKVRLDRARMQRERQDRDVLTGLLLRRAFANQVNALISECARHRFNFSLGLLDVDHFKKVNDSYGHMAGDRVLAHVGKLLRKRFRVEDVRGRWGGEEFILAFRHEKKETMQKALHRVLDELKKIEFKGDQGESFYTSFSAGMVDFPDDGESIHDLVLKADKRLYLAKERGRSRIVIDD